MLPRTGASRGRRSTACLLVPAASPGVPTSPTRPRPRRVRRWPVADLWVVAAAVAAAAGAWSALPVPWWLGAAGAGLALWRRWPAVLCVAVVLLAAGLAHRSLAGATPLPAGPVRGEVTLLDDPVDRFGAVRATARLGRAHVELWARRGRGRPAAPPPGGRAAHHHRPDRTDVPGDRRAAGPPARAGPGARRRGDGLVTRRRREHGREPHPAHHRGGRPGAAPHRPVPVPRLRAGRRPQPVRRGASRPSASPDSRTSPPFRVRTSPFCCCVAGPGLQRLGLRGRWLGTLALIAWFALLTRFEPSVLRASVMAGLAATSVFLARPASSVRLLALAVTGLLLLDPLLVWSVGWWLSVGATAGIVVLAGPLAAALPGPRPWRWPSASRSPRSWVWRRSSCGVRAAAARVDPGEPARRTGGRAGDGLGSPRGARRRPGTRLAGAPAPPPHPGRGAVDPSRRAARSGGTAPLGRLAGGGGRPPRGDGPRGAVGAAWRPA